MKKNNIIILIIAVLIVITVTFINYLTYSNYYNNKLIDLVNVILKENPNIDNVELAKLLNKENTTGDNLLSKYGYDKNDLFFNNKVKENLYSNILINTLIIVVILLIYFSIKNIKDKKRNNEIQNLANVIDKINKKDYEFNLSRYNESEFSKLYNTIFKVSLLLKENNEYLNKERLILKNNIADISHQLKTPLTSNTLMIETLLEDEHMSEEKKKQFIEKIYDKNEKICYLIEMLLKLSKLETSVIDFKKDKVNLLVLLNKIKKEVEEQAKLNNICININCEENININIDKLWQEEALTNIIKNCIEFSKVNGNIDITAQDNNFYTIINIKDNGKGIRKEDINKIFNRFHKSENSKGIGIGLNLAKTIIEKDGGIIKVKSEINKYTMFTIKYIK